MSLEDKAQEQEIALWEIINKPSPKPAKYEPGDPGYGPPECEDCEAVMHVVRRGYGFKKCVDCQSLLERR